MCPLPDHLFLYTYTEMLQDITLILISDKDNPSKHYVQFLNDFIYWPYVGEKKKLSFSKSTTLLIIIGRWVSLR